MMFPTYLLDLDMLILSRLDRKTLYNLVINKYIQKLLANQDFWRIRLENYLNLMYISPYINYEFAVKFLDNDGLFEYGYYEACDKGYYQIRQLLKENRKMPSLNITLNLVDGNIFQRNNIDLYTVFVS